MLNFGQTSLDVKCFLKGKSEWQNKQKHIFREKKKKRQRGGVS